MRKALGFALFTLLAALAFFAGSGWWAYRAGRFDEAVRLFDGGSAQFPRSDYRPSWLYWSGRAAQQLGDVETGVARLRLAAIDYHNSYYGRLAVARLAGVRGGAFTPPLRTSARYSSQPSLVPKPRSPARSRSLGATPLAG